ncbi:gamma-glutamyl-gamma-aminobutyrate hydrolase family protein [Candidatus Stoquefichus massiliensis]|uniref:gamma-glutamyl-gamma-aminobutyrate hydrolase family protein n=1 Tax=Candidatus Stoquefichus massiliensis TaxID=1470350 RepID=UPI000488CD0B|nr:gamma-glutamyl-gamma-aminobutyrate hydrolase family protein [Candidatus Stoquefichus massiliensis]
MKAIIGITCSERMIDGRYEQYVQQDYVEAVENAGGIPVLLSVTKKNDMITEQIQRIDGLLVTGGQDVNPMFYKENWSYDQGPSDSYRDQYEIELIKQCADRRIPILGICRGQQIINVAFGGTLYQDNRYANEYVFQHEQKERREYPTHIIRIKKDSFLFPIFGDKAYVNSFHHQSIKKIADEFRVVARSEDSIVEAIQHNILNILGVQFHPECMCQKNEQMQKLFDVFVYQCNYQK